MTDWLHDLAFVSQGNPGALSVFAEINDKDTLLSLLVTLQECRIFGSDIWEIYKNKCQKDIHVFLKYSFCSHTNRTHVFDK